jgi:hypothetical protein
MLYCRSKNWRLGGVLSGFVSLWTSPDRLGRRWVMTISPERAEQIVTALSATLDGWYEAAMEISDAAVPITGNRARGLHLAKSILQVKLMLEKMREAG